MIPLLEVKDLTKNYPVTQGLLKRVVGQVHAVNDVSFTISKGETLGLVGESGCGKTTVGKLILRLIQADSGTICFEGEDITHIPQKEMRSLRKKLQIIFQDPYGSLNPRMDIMSILSEPTTRMSGSTIWNTFLRKSTKQPGNPRKQRIFKSACTQASFRPAMKEQRYRYSFKGAAC